MMNTNVIMVFPRFNPNSFWSFQESCDIRGARCPAPPLGLITVAALLPQEWSVRLVNRNAEDLQPADLAWADMVMTGGMLVQRHDVLALMEMCRSAGKPVVVGGPDATSSPEAYEQADFLVCGEAEGVIDTFIDAWNAGSRRGVFAAEKFTVDVAKSPIPRFDLLNFNHYLFIGVQFSRGCPFNCEFCDIIELYGRIPRSKTNTQMLAELQTLYDAGHRGHVDFVDDNLIGNKKALKKFLPELISWQKERGYPFQLSTEASLNLADEAELLDMMAQANFFAVFMGVESPDTETLLFAQKKQNTKRSISESIHIIYDAGILVVAGFIIGFDTETRGMAGPMIECIKDTSIPVSMIGLLVALPNTQLSRRLTAEARLLPLNLEKGDQCTSGLNFITLRPRRDILQDYKTVLEAVYQPEAYFERVRAVGLALKRPNLPAGFDISEARKDLAFLARLMWRMTVQRPDLRRCFWRTFADVARRNPQALESVVYLIVGYLHLGAFAQYLIKDLERQIEAIDQETHALSAVAE